LKLGQRWEGGSPTVAISRKCKLVFLTD
jgi:hypothetical protein